MKTTIYSIDAEMFSHSGAVDIVETVTDVNELANLLIYGYSIDCPSGHNIMAVASLNGVDTDDVPDERHDVRFYIVTAEVSES